MDFTDICKMQVSDDEERGFAVHFHSARERHAQLLKDITGLVGEVGEFSNITKKVGLKLDHPRYMGQTLAESRGQLGKELADIVIYTIRLAAIIDIDLEKVVLETINTNKDRYAYLKR